MRRSLLARLVALVLLVLPLGSLAAQPAAEPSPEQVRSLLQLLSDPVVKTWIARELQVPAPAAPAPTDANPTVGAEAATFLEAQLATLKQRLEDLAVAVPNMPGDLLEAEQLLFAELEASGWGRVLLLLILFVGLGYGCERLFARALSAPRQRVLDAPLATPHDRIRAVLAHLAYGAGQVAAFALGSIGAFLALSWPPGLRALLLGYLMAVLVLRIAMVIARFLLAPERSLLRLVPMTDGAARIWYRAATAFVGWFAFGLVTIQLLRRFGADEPTVKVLAYLLGLGLVGIALRLIARVGATLAGRLGAVLAVIAIYVTWVLELRGTMWLLIVALLLPLALRAGRQAVAHLYRPADADPATGEAAGPMPPDAILLDRAIRFVLLLGAVVLLAWGWDVDYGTLTDQDDPLGRLTRGVLHAVVILLVADLLWKLASTAIDRRIAASGSIEGHDHETVSDLPPEEERRRARIRTLLPILRITLMAVLAVMAVLMAFSALGIEIAPLIAGAGVIGVAVGFGSQTLVRDVISGVFYLMDDAFRVGEYIVSGTFRGTVEGFSLRSIRLRHHRGPLFTVPFGNLGAVQNMSRDWVIDKITFNVPFDTDVAQVKRIVKRVSAEIMQDPELAKGIIEPLKSQGVYAMTDFAMQIRVKFKARPGGQFAVRRAAYDRIKRALAENGIKIAVPTVEVSGDGGTPAAAAHAALGGGRAPEPM